MLGEEYAAVAAAAAVVLGSFAAVFLLLPAVGVAADFMGASLLLLSNVPLVSPWTIIGTISSSSFASE